MDAGAFRLDVRQVRRAFERAARAGEDAAVLQTEVERRMLERLDYIRLRPGPRACSMPAAVLGGVSACFENATRRQS